MFVNREKQGCFTDVYVYSDDSIILDYYPRGTTAFGLFSAVAGLGVDRPNKIIYFAPVKDKIRIPLTFLADWESEAVPWAEISRDLSGKLEVSVMPESATRGWEIRDWSPQLRE